MLLGEYTERQAVQRKMLIFSVLAGIAIFFFLHTSFKSARLAALSSLLLPSAMVGGILAAWLGDGVVSLGSMVGFLTVLGISARNGILMINHFQHLEDQEGEDFGAGLVLRGARRTTGADPDDDERDRTGSGSAGDCRRDSGNEIEHPMAIVILGGLVTSTLLNLFVVPSLYLRFGRRRPSNGADWAACVRGN